MIKKIVTFVTIAFVTLTFVMMTMGFVTITAKAESNSGMTYEDAWLVMSYNYADFTNVMWKAQSYLNTGKTLNHCLTSYGYWWRSECRDFGWKYWDYKTKLDKLQK